MTSILLNVSESMLKHIDDFKDHYNFHSRHEAVRILILRAFEAYGNPLLDEPVRLERGRPKANASVGKVKQPSEATDFYTNEYKQKLGFFNNAEDASETS